MRLSSEDICAGICSLADFMEKQQDARGVGCVRNQMGFMAQAETKSCEWSGERRGGEGAEVEERTYERKKNRSVHDKIRRAPFFQLFRKSEV